MKKEIYCTRFNNSLSSYYLEPFISQNFNLLLSPSDEIKSDQILLLSMPYEINDSIIRFLEQGGKCIIDGLWESNIFGIDHLSDWKKQCLILISSDRQDINGFKTVSIPQWFWYSESLWYSSLGYDQYLPDFTKKYKKMFMPIRRQKSARDKFFNLINSELDNSIWSYVEKGKRLPGYPDGHDIEDQRYFNENWYDSTWFSMVVETSTDFNDGLFVTEKTCKPLAYYHPFMIFGQPGTLKQIRNWGFETFPELFDETYDDIENIDQRIERIVQSVKDFKKTHYSTEIKEKLFHNRNLFFDKSLVEQRIKQNLIFSLLEFIDK